jgi:NAD-dependent deacetylase
MSHPTAELPIDGALAGEIERAAELLCRARRVVALTGAGLSVESGIPPFRGPGGLWTKYGEPPLDGHQRFLRDPAAAWRKLLSPSEPWLRALHETLGAARPNAGHVALAELERLGRLDCLITQNVDDLHRQAGSRAVAEIHGNYSLLRCLGCGARFERAGFAIDPDHLPPRCPDCGGIVKSDTVSFGEPIPEDVLARCFDEVGRADCMLVAGTSATVYPAAGFPVEVARSGGSLIEINPEPTDLTPLATVHLCGPGGALLARLVERVRARLAEAA